MKRKAFWLSLLIVAILLTGKEAWALTWKVESVDNGMQFTDLAVDSAGYPHIGYEGASYARLFPDGWRFQRVVQGYVPQNIGLNTVYTESTSLALDSREYPHLLYHLTGADAKLVYAAFDGTQWQFYEEPADTHYGFHASLALDQADRPHFVFTLDSAFIYQFYDGSAWQQETLETDQVNNCQLRLDSADQPHVGYCIYSLYAGMWQVIYQHKDTNGWHRQVVYSDSNPLVFNSLALDADGQPHLIFSSQDGKYLKHAYYDGTNWQVNNIATGIVVTGARMEAGRQGGLHVAYFDATNKCLKYAWYDGAWNTETVDQVSGISYNSVSLALDEDRGTVHISYFDTDLGHLKYAHSLSDEYPESSFAVSAVDGQTPFPVSFTDKSSGQIDSWVWNFGDGTTSNTQNPTHTYRLPGDYDVSLTVSGPYGYSQKIQRKCVWAYHLPATRPYLAYIGNRAGVVVIDCQKQVFSSYSATMEMPTSITSTKDGRYVYFAQKDSGGIIKYDFIKDTVKFLPTIAGTWALTMSPDDKYVYASTNSADNYVWRIRVADDNIVSIPLFDETAGWSFSGANGIAITTDGQYLFPATQFYKPEAGYSSETGWLARLTDLTTPAPKVEALSLKSPSWGICVSPDNRYLYYASGTGVTRVPVDDMRKFSSNSIDLGSDTFEVRVSPDNRWLYVTVRAPELYIIDTSTFKVVKTLPLTDEGRGLAFTPDNKYAYVGSYDRVTLVDVASQKIVKTFGLGDGNWGFSIHVAPIPRIKSLPWLQLLLGNE